MYKTIDLDCISCNTPNSKSITWIDPFRFKDPSKAVVSSTFFCRKCQNSLTAKFKFLPAEELELLELSQDKEIHRTLQETIDLHNAKSLKELITEEDKDLSLQSLGLNE